MKLRAVILDFGGVICFHPTPRQIADAARACDLTVDEFLRAFWKNRIAYDAGQDPYEYWRDVAASAGRVFEDALISEMIQREIDFWSHFDYRVLAWTQELRSQGIRIGILSNLPRPLGAKLRNDSAFIGHFDHVTFSFELGIVKPDRAIYEHAVCGLKVQPEQALFIDDRPENIAGAEEAGLRTELYTTWEAFQPRVSAP